LPGWLDSVIAKALAKDPEARFQTAREFGAALLAAREELNIGGGSESRGEAPAAKNDRSSGLPAAVTAPVTRAPRGENATSPPALGTGSRAPAPSPWSPGDIEEIVRQLTPILGPLAKITVKRAAAQAPDRAELYQILARELRSDDERKRFLATAPRDARKDNASMPHAASQPSNPAPELTQDQIAPATLERAAKILTRYLGPIAVVIVKKTAVSASDESDLYARLAERIADSRERARCVAELTRAF
jgi:serine/threonine-protein kinase